MNSVRLVKGGPDNDNDMIEMKYMAPFSVGVIEDMGSAYNGHMVMRTASSDNFEVMDLSTMKPGSCWASGNGIKVRLLPKGQKIVLEVV